MKKSLEFVQGIIDVPKIMRELEKAGVAQVQDWKTEKTTYIFEDNSKIVIQNSDVFIK